MWNRHLVGSLLGLALGAFPSYSQTQKIAITGCSTSIAPVTGGECNKAYDGNTGTEWKLQAITGSPQEMTVDFGTTRRIKRIVVNWGVPPNGGRDYICVDAASGWHWVASRTGSQTTDDITLNWGSAGGGPDTVCDAKSLVIATYSTTVGGLKEVNLYGPGIYTNEKIQVKAISIPAWNMNSGLFKCIDLPPEINPERIVGLSAVIRSDHGTIHQLARLKAANLTINGVKEFQGTDMGWLGVGGNVGVSYEKPCNLNKWQIFVEINAKATFYTHGSFSNLATNPRGYARIEYLSVDPDYP